MNKKINKTVITNCFLKKIFFISRVIGSIGKYKYVTYYFGAKPLTLNIPVTGTCRFLT